MPTKNFERMANWGNGKPSKLVVDIHEHTAFEKIQKNLLDYLLMKRIRTGLPRTIWTDEITKDIEMRGEIWKKCKKTVSGRTVGDSSVIVGLYL